MKKSEFILDILKKQFPDAQCELLHEDAFQLAVAVVLSAQATDVSVNKVTPSLFKMYPDAKSMAKASINDLETHIKTIGLYHNKAKSILGLAQKVVSDYDGIMPHTMDELIKLPGVGRKSANVILSECFGIPAIAVDTHVERISKRLGLAKIDDSVLEVEKKLMKSIKKEEWTNTHHLFIFFGRYFCKAKNPMCYECKLIDICKEKKKNLLN